MDAGKLDGLDRIQAIFFLFPGGALKRVMVDILSKVKDVCLLPEVALVLGGSTLFRRCCRDSRHVDCGPVPCRSMHHHS